MLSTSALATAVAIVALKVSDDSGDSDRINDGFNWLCRNVNTDGGFGDTTGSESNVSSTLLCYAAVSYCRTSEEGAGVLIGMKRWLARQGVNPEADTVTESVLKFYGNDYTFSVPILSMLALCGVIPSSSLEKIPQLPFELTLLPSSFYRFLNLRVVSYALPALIGVGIYLHKNRSKNIFRTGILRDRFIKPAIRKLNSLVPQSGGFLEAVPLTGFVAMCLTAAGENENQTVARGLGFLRSLQRGDGGWPIDTDLSTWVTTLSVKALGGDLKKVPGDSRTGKLRDHLLSLQYRKRHPFNGALPGGWGWTHYSGSVPDVDDSAGAILALLEMFTGSVEEISAITKGCRWLIGLQNCDGGFPTFCRGWGKLPFDKSCADLTGHALLALLKTKEMIADNIPLSMSKIVDKAVGRALDYLEKNQTDNGAWLPLWFGNQHTDDKTNPVYGTAKVGLYLSDCLGLKLQDKTLTGRIARMVKGAQKYLLSQQNNDGSWGGKKGAEGTIEETALAICALAREHKEECVNGIIWMGDREELTAAPIGLYFAMLWYDEMLYPLIFYTEALRRYLDE